ncbi:uncharacterized protein LOC106055436 isoform X2 [Biomphalaria glabrata]|uniref:Uncharacterized protein LOC106055436 isoform X2 n=1 Tax=Biomphalaria glabrata TaxID=6526 RepID=A0A9U8DZ80_BIOGL|nr:uncharacterized protein LOC106055436 isoform X2 [Biomphalaria glabrata]
MAYYIPYRREYELFKFDPIQHFQKGQIIYTYQPEPMKPFPEFSQHFGSRTPLEECSMFEQPYFSSRYIQMPTNYNTFLPRWVNARITKDNLSVWANAGIYHDRAFGEWHNVFGPRYLYGENRRL